MLLVTTLLLAAGPTKIAVLDVQPKGVDKAAAATLSDVIVASLKKLRVFDVISRSDIEQMLAMERVKDAVGCGDATCLAEIGGALGVAKVVTGSVGLVGKTYVLNLSLFDTKAARVIDRDSRSAASLDALIEQVDGTARFLVRSLLETHAAELRVRVSEPQAEIEIDGLLAGLSPLPRVKLASGPHKLRVSKRGFITVAQDVVVDAKGDTIEVMLVPSLELIQAYDRLADGMRIAAYASTALGAAMIATGFGLYYGYTAQENARHNAAKAALDARDVPPSDQEISDINTGADRIALLDRVAIGVGVAGGVLAVAGAVLFLVGPKPGAYDQHKAVELGYGKVSLSW